MSSNPTQPPPRGQLVELTEKERRRYSIARAVSAACGLSDRRCFEGEVSDEVQRQLPAEVMRRGGLFVPTFFTRAALDATTPGRGDALVYAEPGSFITALRKRSLVMRMGARLIAGLKGNVSFPRQLTTSTAQWMPEPPTTVSESNMTLDQVPLSARILMGRTTFSRQLLTQSTPAVDQVVADDLAATSAQAVDLASVHGTGAANQPTGLYSKAGVGSVAFGGSVSYAKLCDMEHEIGRRSADTDPASMGWLTTSAVRRAARETEEFSGNGRPVWRDGRMLDYPAAATEQVRSDMGAGSNEHGLVLGVWGELLVGEWGAVEVVADRYTGALQALVRVTSFYLADVNFRHEESFCKATGLIPA